MEIFYNLTYSEYGIEGSESRINARPVYFLILVQNRTKSPLTKHGFKK